MKLASPQHPMIRNTSIILLLAVVYLPALGIQEQRSLDQTAPPPLKIVTRLERGQLESAKDEKSRVKLSIDLAEAHLLAAENQTSQQQFDGAAAEAGMYWAIIDDAFNFMKNLQRENSKKRDLYKRLELTLRAHGPRLTIIRRSTPSEYAVWIKDIEELARKGRTEALNSFYGQTVLREGPQTSTDAKDLIKPQQE